MKKLKIGKPCSPSKLIYKKETPITHILVTFGGGMGGARKEFYAMSVEDTNDGFLKITDFLYRTYVINKSFIVFSNPASLVLIKVDTTEHSNFRKTVCSKSEVSQWFLIEQGEEAEVVDSCLSNDVKPIYTERETV